MKARSISQCTRLNYLCTERSQDKPPEETMRRRKTAWPDGKQIYHLSRETEGGEEAIVIHGPFCKREDKEAGKDGYGNRK